MSKASNDRARRRRELRMQERLEEARGSGYTSGHAVGMSLGQAAIRVQVLEHAGVLYQRGQDVEAAAVRRLYHQLSGQPVQEAAEKQRA